MPFVEISTTNATGASGTAPISVTATVTGAASSTAGSSASGSSTSTPLDLSVSLSGSTPSAGTTATLSGAATTTVTTTVTGSLPAVLPGAVTGGVSIGGGVGATTGGVTPVSPPSTVSVAGGSGAAAASSGYPDAVSAYVSIFRLGSASEIAPSADQQLKTLQSQVASGAITAKTAVLAVADLAAGHTALAETSYNFFTGLTPSGGGLSYLVHSAANPTDLSDSYYAAFNLENRYINFASNLGLHSSSAPAFAQAYGAMSFEGAVAVAYERIIGSAQARAAGVDPVAAIADVASRKPYFEAVAHERFGAEDANLSVKLAAIAYLMQESVRAHVGLYGEASRAFLFDLADGQAVHGVELVGTYGPGTAMAAAVAG